VMFTEFVCIFSKTRQCEVTVATGPPHCHAGTAA